MPARKKRLRSYKARKEKKKNLLPFFLIILLFGALLFYILATSAFWDGKSKLSLVINNQEEVIVSTFDPTNSEIINIYIPGDTEVELSRNLGKIRIKNAWAVGLNQGEEGVI